MGQSRKLLWSFGPPRVRIPPSPLLTNSPLASFSFLSFDYNLRVKPSEIIRRRLANQHLVASALKTPAQVVAAQGAVQSQDFYGGLWGIGVRLPATTEAQVEEWFTDGRILRFHILRPTWHFVAREDVRWMLALSAPRVHRLNASMHPRLGIDAAVLKRSARIIEKALRGRTLTRNELGRILDEQGVRVGQGEGQRLAYLMFFAELEGLVTSGPRRGKQFTYTLLDERVPAAGRPLARPDALAELARRYFGTRGPATAADFAWWSGLTLGDCRTAARSLDSELRSAEIEGETYWWSEARPPAKSLKGAWLLPNYDEYGIGYANRDLIFDAQLFKDVQLRDRPIFSHFYMVDGRSTGTWKREPGKAEVRVTLSPFEPPLPAADLRALKAAAKRYADFLQLKPVVAVD